VAGNPNLFGPRDKEAINELNTWGVSLLGGKTAASSHDTKVILKMVVILLVGEDSIDRLRRLEIAVSVCLLVGYLFLAWVRSRIKKFERFRFTWGGLEMQDPALQHVKWIVHLRYLEIRFGRYFNHQQKSPTPQPFEAAEHLMCQIQDSDVAWAPALSFAL
jgi:hypothetical protein